MLGGGKGILCSEEKTFTLSTVDNMRVCMNEDLMVLMDQGGGVMNIGNDMVGTLRAQTHGHEPIIQHNTVVRRLTPVECERLQGFPDNWTNIHWRNQPTAPDSHRYKACGNSMAVPVMKFIGQRIMDAEPVVFDQESITRILTVTPLNEAEMESGQQTLF